VRQGQGIGQSIVRSKGYRVRSVASLENAVWISGSPKSEGVGRKSGFASVFRLSPAELSLPTNPIMLTRRALAITQRFSCNGTAIFEPGRAEMVFEGLDSSCYLRSQVRAAGIVAIHSHRLN